MALFYVVLAVLCSVIQSTATADEQKYWDYSDCAGFTTPDTCTAVGWCLWSTYGSPGCFLDPCLKYLANENATCANTTVSGVDCGAFYFTNKTECNGSVTKTDMFCQAVEKVNGVGGFTYDVIPAYFDWCFYKTLELSTWKPANPPTTTEPSGAWSISGALCEWKTVKPSDTVGNKQYSGQKDGVEDCTGLYDEGGISEDYCNCLGESNCPLSPYCWVKEVDNKKKCIYDPCTTDYNGTCVNSGNCWKRSMNIKTGSSSLGVVTLCVNKARTNATQLPNECYFLQNIESDCDSGAQARCEAGLLYNDDFAADKQGSTYPDGDSKAGNCAWVPIAPGIIPASNYCTDTRSVPSPDSDGSVIVHVSSLLVLALVLIGSFF